MPAAEQFRRVVADYVAGMTLKETSEKYGIGVRRIMRALKQAGVRTHRPGPRHKKGPQNPERDRAIHEARQSGRTLKSLGQVYGLSRERIRQIEVRYKRENGLTKP